MTQNLYLQQYEIKYGGRRTCLARSSSRVTSCVCRYSSSFSSLICASRLTRSLSSSVLASFTSAIYTTRMRRSRVSRYSSQEATILYTAFRSTLLLYSGSKSAHIRHENTYYEPELIWLTSRCRSLICVSSDVTLFLSSLMVACSRSTSSWWSVSRRSSFCFSLREKSVTFYHLPVLTAIAIYK